MILLNTVSIQICLVRIGNIAQWEQYTMGPYRNIDIPDGNHYFISTHYREVCVISKFNNNSIVSISLNLIIMKSVKNNKNKYYLSVCTGG